MIMLEETGVFCLLFSFLGDLGDKIENTHLRGAREGKAFLFSCEQTGEFFHGSVTLQRNAMFFYWSGITCDF